MKRTERNHGVAFKAQVVFDTLKGNKTLTELAARSPRWRAGSQGSARQDLAACAGA